MSHQVDSLAYTGATPWHGIGRVLPKYATVEDMVREAGIDWEVSGFPVFCHRATPTAGQELVTVPGYKSLVRQDTGTPLAIVGDEYGIVQNKDAFGIAAAACMGDARAEVGGALDGGRRVFILLSMNSMEIAGDEVKPYLLCYAGHDGRTPVAVRFTPVRVVCANTMAAALSGGSLTELRIRHTSHASDRVQAAADMITAARAYFGEFHARALALVKQRLTQTQAIDITTALFRPYKSAGKTIVPAMGQKVLQLFTRQGYAATDRHLADTRWGYFNALTAALDHNGRNTGPSARMARAVSGSQDALRGQALELLAA